uniref:Uncharacterized protein LOC114913722 n=1 Tax=Elaeis guineensis var. tenera TaxID=51953 RepID=A0A8N4EZK5_ELAGV
GEILRPGITWFATNCIALDSLLQKKIALRQMFVSAEWQESRNARADTDRSHVENLVMSQSFWQRAEKIVKAIKPLYEVLRTVDSERYPQMGFLYYMMERAKKQISENDPKQAQEFINIIECHWDYQMGRDLHLTTYYLNLRFQYTILGIDMDSELLTALCNVIYKMVPDPEIASLSARGNSVTEGHKGGKEKTVARAPLSRVQERPGSDTDTRECDDDTDSISHGSDDQGGTKGQEITVYETQPQSDIRFTDEFQFTYVTQDRDHDG